MSGKNRATGDTETEFQAALATYTKAGNKTAAMRRLWNTAYEIGRVTAETATNEATVMGKEKMSERVEEAKKMGFEEGRQSGFEEGRRTGEKDALSMDAFEVSFAAGKMAGIATGMEQGREVETQRWKDIGHFEDGTCRAFGSATIVDSSPQPQPLPLDDDAGTFSVPGAFSVHMGFNWADDAESLPIHRVPVASPQPRDFSGLRTGSTNPFDTLQRRHARHHGAKTWRRPRQPRLYSPKPYTNSWVSTPCPPPTPSDSNSWGLQSSFRIFAWIWILLYGSLQGHIFLGYRRAR
ncbi:hypothetical protein B0H11DRAFT_501201 [Mycena galericulata]|nr:hypothetical protein B0H11DRAFT_501201 [Mycena galericulata]